MKSYLSKIYNFLFSTKAAGFYLVLFAFAIAIGTFIENDFGTSSAQALIYRAKWFEILLLLFASTLVANVIRYKMVRNRKWATLIFHLSIIIILAGAAITRYFGYEGIMSIREGSSSNYFLSAENYLKFKVMYQGKTYSFDEPVHFSTLGNNKFDEDYQIGSNLFNIRVKEFIPNPGKQIENDPKGKAIVNIVVSGSLGREDHFVTQGEKVNIEGVEFNFTEAKIPGAINLAVMTEYSCLLLTLQLFRQ